MYICIYVSGYSPTKTLLFFLYRNWSSYTKAVAQLGTDPMSSPPLSLILLPPTLRISSCLLSPSEVLMYSLDISLFVYLFIFLTAKKKFYLHFTF